MERMEPELAGRHVSSPSQHASRPPPPPPPSLFQNPVSNNEERGHERYRQRIDMSTLRGPAHLRTAFSASFRRRFHARPPPGGSLDEAGPLACRLESRSVVRFRGPDTLKFLQGLLTNDVRRLGAADPPGSGGSSSDASDSYVPTQNLDFRSPPPLYAALLTPQGRFLYDLFLYRPPRADEKLDRTGSGPGSDDSGEPFTLMADVDSAFVDELLDCFKKYRLRSKVEIDNVAKEYSCWQQFGTNHLTKVPSAQEPEAASVGWGKGIDDAAISSTQGNDVGWQWFKDPRSNCLGFRGIFPSNSIPPLVEADKEVGEQHYLIWRYQKGIPEGSSEIPKGEAVPLEYNLVGLNAISFDKGCYVGQELVARTHHRGVIRKRLFPLKFLNDKGEELQQAVSPYSEIKDGESNKKVGAVTAALGCHGLGLVRLEAALKQSSNLCIKDKEEVRVKIIKPDWWPIEWMQLEEQQSAAA